MTVETATAPLAVGFIGLGDQGLPMAIAIGDAGHPLHVWARRPGSLAALGETARTEHESARSLARASDVVILCVRTDDDVLSLLVDDILPAVRPGTVVVNAGTGTPDNARRAGQMCAEAGAAFLDAPVSGGRQGAEVRRLTTLVGGPVDAVARASAVFDSYSAHVLHCGDSGAGQLVKLLNNTLLMMNRANVAEVFALAGDTALDPIALAEALTLGSGASEALVRIPTRSPVSLAATAAHLSEIELLDVDLFAAAMTDLGIDAAAITARATAGASALPAVVALLNPEPADGERGPER